ncbi:hypothetical protein CLORY_43940 [Clostridium oryzae]|uniref:Uncharacterized protein n=1 Tax=Clostridium oryzae TaxID=1450648 RepID=A0A1V4I6S2_9CLOT|nr:hypothetical protein CLORY_43940 [Clostridium oryzae]
MKKAFINRVSKNNNLNMTGLTMWKIYIKL